ncbi:hypothetical protein CANCADRAFT_25766 [Tortispora caseinolytica NRRL Y-17796]|uniref:GPI ethanolamine phosphate transferase 1 n=1 Tax=Tortispora caseinolytica NRRL Y-17796 TaxID=767744 RepID=A0A1E4TH25_9ASCO|nr:hypothetical protein CANCADRAFT_25766 [Tortispora caseinolytica NRRL Y-17796]
MDRFSRRTLLVVGLLFHLVYLWSIFDIYFVSPLVHGMDHHKSSNGPANRLVLFVGDGLRADKTFLSLPDPNGSENVYLAPFLRDIVLNLGTFGVSHTRMPTESRPGHVALIAGFYEDVSAVTKGWKENPVDFDSVFNQSSHTWSWGSPDILPMFASGAVPGRVDTYTYDSDFEDFTKSSLELDAFVFDRVEALFNEAKSNVTLAAQLRKPGVVFFLHLLGLDTAGHSKRPYSPEYYRNIQYVDAGVKKIYNMIEDFYNDGKTAYVFTADHGMSDWGSHGDGHPDNTRTPLISWGAGVAKPKLGEQGHDEYSKDWNLPVQRHDVAQADIAALMAYLVGLNYPANSVGTLPLDFIDTDQKSACISLLANAEEILEQYIIKEKAVIASQFRFTPFAPLSDSNHYTLRLSFIKELILKEQYDDAIKNISELIQLSFEGLNYLQKYNWSFLRSIVTIGFLGWMAYAFSSVILLFVLPHSDKPAGVSMSVRFSALTLFLSMCYVLWYQNSPLMYYFYSFFPFYFVSSVVERAADIRKGLLLFAESKSLSGAVITVLKHLVPTLIMSEGIVLGYFNREWFSVGVLLLGFWPYFHNFSYCKANLKLVGSWTVLATILSVFTLLPANKVDEPNQILAGGILMALIGIVGSLVVLRQKNTNPTIYTRLLLALQLILVGVSLVVTLSTVEDLQNNIGLQPTKQMFAWICLVMSILLPIGYRYDKGHVETYAFCEIILFLSYSPAFIILTISYEGLFYVTYFLALIQWIEVSRGIYTAPNTKKPHEKLPLSIFFLASAAFFFSQLAFFGTGNIASISSFSLDSVTRLLPVFDPFPMGALLIFKILCPFVIVSASLSILNHKLLLPTSAIFTIVISVSDIVTLNFFYLVKDEGSWLDIGQSISNYSIACCICAFVMLLEYIGNSVVRGIEN